MSPVNVRRCGGLLIGLIAALALLHVRAAGQSAAQAEPQAQIMNELVALRADLMEYLVQVQQGRIEWVSRELSDIHDRQTRLVEEEKAQRREVAEVEQQLGNPSLESETHPQLEALKQQLMTEGTEKLRQQGRSLQQREAELQRLVAFETKRLQVLQERAQRVLAAVQR